MIDVHRFEGQHMDLDTEARDLPPNATRECYNIRSGNTSTNGKNNIETIKSNLDISTLPINAAISLPPGINKSIGTVKDIENNALINFVQNSNGNHCILRIFLDNRIEKILYRKTLLYFSKRINHANVIGGMLMFTDGVDNGLLIGQQNSPRKLNIVRATAMTNQFTTDPILPAYDFGHLYLEDDKVEYNGRFYRSYHGSIGIVPTNVNYWFPLRTKYVKDEILGYTGNCYQVLQDVTTQDPTDASYFKLIEYKHYDSLTKEILSRGKNPPFQPTFTITTDKNVTINRLRDKIFQFRTRYIYDDNEKSTWSCMSIPTLINLESQDGYYSDGSINNTINLSFNTGTKEVVRVQISTRINNGDWVLVDDIHKYDKDWNVLITSNTTYSYAFKNDIATLPLDQTETNNLFSYTPQISSCQEAIQGVRLVDADITEGYDYPTVTCALEVDYVENTAPSETTLTSNYSGGSYVFNMPLFSEFVPISFLRFGVPVSLSNKVMIEYFPKDETTIAEILANLVPYFAKYGITATAVINTIQVVSANYGSPSFTLVTNQNRIGGFKYDSHQNLGICFYDELKRSTSVVKLSPITIPSLNTLVGGQNKTSIPSPVINFTLTGTPPEQAYSYKFCHTDNRYNFLDLVIPNVYIDDDNVKKVIRLNIDKAILDYLTAKPNSTVQPWTWVKGDRIRILGYSNYDSIDYFANEYDLEILAIETNKLTGVVEYIIPYEVLEYSNDWLVETYRDIPVNNEATVYLECGEEYLITSPRTADRSYGVLTGTINGYDAFQRSRSQKGSYAYVVDASSHYFQIIDTTVGVVVSSTLLQDSPNFITVAGQYAYIISNGHLLIYDISNVSRPSLAYNQAMDIADLQCVRIYGNYAYVLSGNDAKVQTVNIASPTSPIKYTAIALSSGPMDIAFNGTHAYVSCFGSGRIDVIDISNPQIPVNLNTPVSGLNNPRRMFLVKDTLYVADSGSATIRIYDVSTEASPVLSRYSAALNANIYSVFVQGNYIYCVSHNSNTLQILDNSPIQSEPILIRTISVGANPYDLWVSGKYAFTVNYGAHTVSMVDITDPTSVVSNITTKDQPRSLYVTGSSSFNCIESRDYSDIFRSDQGDLQRVAVYDPQLKRQRIKTLLRWGGVFLQNTFKNDLGLVDYANYEEVNETFGGITKIFEYGDILTVRQMEKTTTYYLSQAVLQQAAQAGQEIVTTSTKILGSKHQSAERWGCQNPESHVSIGSISFYIDVKNGAIIRDGYAESVVISDKGIKNYIKSNFAAYNTITCVGGYDYSKDELYLTFLLQNITSNSTSSTSFTILWNEQEKCFKSFLLHSDPYGNIPEVYGSLGLGLHTFVLGEPWLTEAGIDYNNFCGKILRPIVTVIGKGQGKSVYKSIKVISNLEWKSDYIYVFDNAAYERQQSKLPKMVKKENYYFAPFLRNSITHNPTPNTNDLYNGDSLRGDSIQIMLEATENGLTQLYEVSIDSIPSL